MNIVLASSSIFRRQLLSKLGIPFECISPNIDESRKKNESVHEYVRRLSINKAQKVSEDVKNSIIIGSDEVADLDGNILGKPLTTGNAKKQLKMMSGKKIIFRTGLCVLNSKTKKYYASVNNYYIHINNLDDNIINNYLKKEDVLKCAGSIRIEGYAINLVSKMTGKDPSSIMGLPLLKLINYLDKFGIKTLKM